MTFGKDTAGLVVIDPCNDFISPGGKVWERFDRGQCSGPVKIYRPGVKASLRRRQARGRTGTVEV